MGCRKGSPTRHFGRDLSASRTLTRRERQRALVDCQRQIDCGSLPASYSLAEHRLAFSDLDRNELEGARVRSRLLWTEQGETSPKLFSNFEHTMVTFIGFVMCLVHHSSIGVLLDIGESFTAISSRLLRRITPVVTGSSDLWAVA